MNRENQQGAPTSSRGTALGSAFEENAARIYSFIYAKVGNREAAEDLTSQVFLKATRWLAGDRGGDSIRSWLYTTARSTIVDYWREQHRSQSVPLDDPDALLFRGTDGPEEVRRTRERALRVLAGLPEREREVLRLRFLHGYSADEIGRALGLTPGHVRVVQLRALRRAAAQESPHTAATERKEVCDDGR
ncbi:MAG: sigma-70 family RNA polymerase sigma factor [Chloroflexota bacterium]